MTKILNYIRQQLENIESTIEDEKILKQNDLLEVTEYISRRTKYIYGNNTLYYDTKDSLSFDTLILADNGINQKFLERVKDKADKQPLDEKGKSTSLDYFLSKTIRKEKVGKSYKYEKEIQKVYEKLYASENFTKVTTAFCNVINYRVLSNFSTVVLENPEVLTKMYNSFSFKNLPYGPIPPISPAEDDFSKDRLVMQPFFVLQLFKRLFPYNINFTDSDSRKSGRVFQAVVNKDEKYIKIEYSKMSKARGYIDSTSIRYEDFDNESSCQPLTISAETDKSYFSSNRNTTLNKSSITKQATKVEYTPISVENKCSTDDLAKIALEKEFVSKLNTDETFIKVNSVLGKDLLKNIESLNRVSRNFPDTALGLKAITIKLVFDKKNDKFVNVRVNDLYFALSCATYGDSVNGLVDFYYRKREDGRQDVYIVNSNETQFGYCISILETATSNCINSSYLELLQPSLSVQDKYNLFIDENIQPVILKDGVVERTSGLEDALLRQSYMLSIQDNNIFYDLFMRNIASYVYSYASQIEKKLDDDTDKTELVWQPNKNSKWGKGTFGPNKKGVLQWSEPNYYYIYDVRETFWMNNQNMTIQEVLAFFVSKGGSRYDNSIYYRKLCQRILGVDYYLFYYKLVPYLLKEGLLCVEDIIYDEVSKTLKDTQFSYVYDYTNGNVYKKEEKLLSEVKNKIITLYGDNLGTTIVDRQLSLLDKSKPEKVTFGNKDQTLSLTVSVHNPIFFREKTGYLGKLGESLNIFKNGRTGISTKASYSVDKELYKPIDVQIDKTGVFKKYLDESPYFPSRGHLSKFYEWIQFGPGPGKIAKQYIEPEYIVDGYIYPQNHSVFISKYLLREFKGKNKTGEEISIPLKFISSVPTKSQTWTLTNVYNTNQKRAVGNSYLDVQSRLNLQEAGFISDKAETTTVEEKIDTGKKSATGEIIFATKKVKYLVITKEEGSKIYDTVFAKYNKLESEIKIEGDRLFTLFCQTQLDPDYRKEIEGIWNNTYNSMAIPDYSKFPIFCEHSRWFGNIIDPSLFSLREAQTEGMKFSVANNNSGLLAHEVGFGKTTTSIALISHMILTGESPRTIVFTPNQVYEKFYDEITGRQESGVLGLLGNWITPFPVMKLGNASSNTLIGSVRNGLQVKGEGLKEYTPDEIRIIEKWKDLTKKPTEKNRNNKYVNLAKKTLSSLKKGQPKFFPKKYIDIDKTNRIDDRIVESDAENWLNKFLREVEIYIPELRSKAYIRKEYEDLIEVIVDEIDLIKEKVNNEIKKYKRQVRYSEKSIENKNPTYPIPLSVQDWWKKNKFRTPTNIAKNPTISANPLTDKDYPRQNWVSNINDALKDGVISDRYAKQLQYEKSQGQEWGGVLSTQGLKKIKELESTLAQRFYHTKDKTGRVIRLLNAIQKILVDNLGRWYEKYTSKNQIILCNHGAINRFRVSAKSRRQAKLYVSNVDDEKYVQNNVNTKYDLLALQPLSLTKLNVTGVVVDEIHNFNNLVSKPRAHILGVVADNLEGQVTDEYNSSWHLLPTVKSGAMLNKTPLNDTINIKKGRILKGGTYFNKDNKAKSSPSYKIKFNSTGKGSLKTGPTNLLAIVLEVKNNSKLRGIKQNNTIMMSATPFTDNVFQMFSVFGFTNPDLLKESNLDKVFDFFITFVKEEWRFNITHQNQFGLFAEIQGYYNTSAMSNFIKSFANFKVSDKQIEKTRPIKYLIPQEKGLKNQAGANTASVQYNKILEEVESYVELSKVQKQIIRQLALFVEGKSNNVYTICPNYGDAIKTTESGDIKFATEDVEQKFKEVQGLLRKAKKATDDIQEQDDLLQEAKEIIDELRDDYPNDKRINHEQDKIYTLLYGEVEERDTIAFITSEEDIDSLALDEEDVVSARAIVGQAKGQACVISPYLLPCDKEGKLENELLKDYPLKKDDLSLSAKNFVEQSPKILYAVKCALNSIKYDANNIKNLSEVGGQIIYLDRGKAFSYGGSTFNSYDLIKKYIVDQNFKYFDNFTNKEKILTEDEVAIITGGMTGNIKTEDIDGNTKTIGKREYIRDEFNAGRVKILLGSSAIKEGIDLNKRAHTLYILDSDFSPSNAMQLEGRIWRQKNMWKYVRIVYVLGRDSIDAFVYSKLQQKIGEIKKMLEAGVYELNKTQFTINAKERIRKIISDEKQLAELGWQDEKDNLNKEVALQDIDKAKLQVIQEDYYPVRQELKEYVKLINKLYELLQSHQIEIDAKKLKVKKDILKEHRHRLEGVKKGSEWRRENPYKPYTISEVKKIIEQEIIEGKREVDLPDVELSVNSDMEVINQVIERVRVFVKGNSTKINSIVSLESSVRERVFRDVDNETPISIQLTKTLFDIKNWNGYDEIWREINLFAKGSPKESIMSDYCYLVKNHKDENDKGGYTIDDVESLIAKRQDKINNYKRRLGQEKEFKSREEQKIIKDQEKTRLIVGATLEEQIIKFEKSMKVLELRKKEK